MKLTRFEDLECWQEARKLTNMVYSATKSPAFKRDLRLSGQIQAAAGSVMANIAEGFARYHFKDKVRFYYQARGSVAEVQNFLLLAKDLNYIDLEICKTLGEKANATGKLINGLIRSISNQ